MENSTTTRLVPFDVALDRALGHLMAARAELEPFAVVLTEQERKHLRPVPTEIGEIGDSVLQAASTEPDLTKLCSDYHPVEIRNLLDRAKALKPLLNQVDSMSRLMGDTRNGWHSEAYGSLLALYRVVKVLAETDASYEPIARPLAELFASRQAPHPKTG